MSAADRPGGMFALATAAPPLSPAQRKLAAFALAFSAIVGIVALFGLTCVLLGRFLDAFSNVIWPIATAGILALILRPVATLKGSRRRVFSWAGGMGLDG